jgi:hypothetical protein
MGYSRRSRVALWVLRRRLVIRPGDWLFGIQPWWFWKPRLEIIDQDEIDEPRVKGFSFIWLCIEIARAKVIP